MIITKDPEDAGVGSVRKKKQILGYGILVWLREDYRYNEKNIYIVLAKEKVATKKPFNPTIL